MTVRQRRIREREERRTAIIDAAEEVFVEKGYFSATMDQVAHRAELSKGTLYLYFKNKDDLFIALGSRVLEAVIARFETIEAGEHTDGRALLRDLLQAYADVALERPARFRLAMSWLFSDEERDATTPCFELHREKVSVVVSHIVRSIERGIADCSLRGGQEPRAIATYLWASMVGALLVRSKLETTADPCRGELSTEVQVDEFIESFIDTLVFGLRGGEKQK